jgi:four helix bundle protein
MGVAVYAPTRQLPSEERFVTVPQLRRAAWSVANNIAEGNAKLGRRELRKYLDCAIGSLAEINTMVTILPDVHPSDSALYAEADRLRMQVAKGLYQMLRNPGR